MSGATAVTVSPFGAGPIASMYTDPSMGATVDIIKTGSVTVYFITVNNSANAASAYVKLYNTASVVAVGTTVPDEVIHAPAGQTITHVLYTGSTPGKAFGSAIAAACVTTGGTAGTTAPTNAVPVTVAFT
jgi:hypothetical protein